MKQGPPISLVTGQDCKIPLSIVLWYSFIDTINSVIQRIHLRLMLSRLSRNRTMQNAPKITKSRVNGMI